MVLNGIRVLLALLGALLLAGVARADEVIDAAERVVAAVETEDAEALTALASASAPDPWLVADRLLATGARAAAESFADAATANGRAGLAAYVRGPRDATADAAARAVFLRMAAALSNGDAAAARAAEDDLPAGTPSIPRLRVGMASALVRRALGDLHACGLRLAEVGSEARTLGWLGGALEAYRMAGIAFLRLGLFSEALTAWTARLEVTRALDDEGAEASALHHLGALHRNLDELDEAFAYCEQALAIHVRHDDPYGVSLAVGEMAAIRLRQRRYADAKALFARAIRAKRAIGEDVEAAALLGNLGIVHAKLGELEDAERAYEQALAVHEAQDDEQGISDVLTNLAGIAVRREAWDRALALYTRVLERSERSGDRVGVRLTLGSLGSVHEGLGDLDAAVELYERSLALAESAGARLEVAKSLSNLGGLAADRGRLEPAMAYYERALATLADVPDPEVEARVRWGVASVHHAAERYDAAIDAARGAEPFVEHLVQGLAEQEGAGARDLWGGVAEVGLHASLRAGRVKDAVHFLETARAGTLRESLEVRDELRSVVLPEALRLREAAARRAEFDALAGVRDLPQSASLIERREARDVLGEARRVVETVVAEIQRTQKAGALLLHPKVDDVATMQARLEDRDALLLYGLTPREGVVVLVTRRDARLVVLDASDTLVAAVDRLQTDRPGRDVSEATATLRRLLIDPLALSEDVTRVLVSPVGHLAYVPFALLLPGRDVVYVPSGTTHGLLLGEAARRGRRVLGVGDPNYGASPTQLPSLPGTRAEVEAIADVTLLGERATETDLQRALSEEARWRAVHLACHGLVDSKRPLRSSLALTADDTSDGHLTCLEVFRLSIPADLVVLSACDTGKGRVYRAEGIVGLTRAFLHAGTPRVLCSLWKVDDAATRALMTRFYMLWHPKDGSPGLPAEEALREAQAFVRGGGGRTAGGAGEARGPLVPVARAPGPSGWEHPYYWAAWVLWGPPE